MMLGLSLHLGGSLDEDHAAVSDLFWKIDGIEDNIFAIFRSSQTGICTSLHSTMTQWHHLFSLEVFLEKGAMVLNGLKTSSEAYGDEDLAIKHNEVEPERGEFEGEERIVYHTDTSWASEIMLFFKTSRTDKPVGLGSSVDALCLMTIMNRVYQSGE